MKLQIHQTRGQSSITDNTCIGIIKAMDETEITTDPEPVSPPQKKYFRRICRFLQKTKGYATILDERIFPVFQETLVLPRKIQPAG
jgi:hypothetical protein